MTDDPSRSEPPIEAELRAFFAAEAVASATADDHADAERAAAYLAGGLTAEEAAAVARHVELCPSCAALILDLETLTAEAPSDPDVVDLELAAAWKAMRPKLTSSPPEPIPVPERRVWTGLAALFALVALGLGFRVVQLEQAGSATQANVAIAYLDAVRSQAAEEIVMSTSKHGVWLLVLTPASPPPSVPHRLELFTDDDDLVLRLDGLEATELGTFRAAFTSSDVPAGSYRVRLSATEPAASTEFRLRVIAASQE